MNELVMPRLGFTMTTGVILRWRKKEGDRVEKGDILFEVESDKVTVEVESVYSGFLRKIIGKEGEEIPVQEIIGYIGEKDEDIPVEKSRPVKTGADAAVPSVPRKNDRTGGGNGKIMISPVARKLAKEYGIDYETASIAGTGPGGRISKEDILDYAKSRGEKTEGSLGPSEGGIAVKSSVPLTGVRKVIAEKMSYAKANIPHLELHVKADTTALIKLKEDIKQKVLAAHKITFTDLLLKVCATALREHVEMNSSLQEGNVVIYEDINIGLAVSTEQGLIVPTIYRCDTLGLVDIAKKRIELVQKAREGKLDYKEIINGTFTITNLGMFGIRSFSPIINPPQASILALGEIYPDTAVSDGKIEIRSFMDLSLSCDHRIIDGDTGARFLNTITEYISDPKKLQLQLS